MEVKEWDPEKKYSGQSRGEIVGGRWSGMEQGEGFESDQTLNFIDLFQILGIFGQSIKKMFD